MPLIAFRLKASTWWKPEHPRLGRASYDPALRVLGHGAELRVRVVEDRRSAENVWHTSSTRLVISSEKKDGVQGLLREKVKNDAMNQMMNPAGMMKMMKGNMTFMVSNFVMMGLVGTLDVSYVSSLSLYFLIMFGMSGFMSLLLGKGNSTCIYLCIEPLAHSHVRSSLVVNEDAKAMQMQMGMGAGAGMGFDAPRMYKQERVSLRLHVHEFALEHAEKKLLGDPIPEKVEGVAASSAATTTTSSAGTSSVPRAKHAKRARA
ncbi:hypothetical protein DYB34_000956 [Aphanomyces astaci]|uniref:ER membrane protein complex subunit 3 n=1 Tax=Aphanomyces astaci TaxID=112090 RepID=A0A418C0F1_APHAT|nr:hypothetical protein DYB34_000956 [Aphanomyces astaci]